MNRRKLLIAGAAAGMPLLGLAAPALAHDLDGTDAPLVPAPAGALILFDGTDLSRWVNKHGRPAGWKVQDGYTEVLPGSGDIHTRDVFTDYQLHIEFWLPSMPEPRGQDRSHSDARDQGQIELQMFDSYGQAPRDNPARGIYRAATPIRSASRKPESWQTYDIAYRAPRFGADGRQAERGRVTIFHNSILIHNSVELDAQVPTAGLPGQVTKPGPILLQDHGTRVRYRNIWILPVGE